MVTELKTRPYDGPGDDSLPDSVKKLPKHGREIFVSAFNNAWDNYDPDSSQQDSQEAYAMAVAWGAVKKVYEQDEDGNWQERSFVLGTFDGTFTKITRSADGKVTWRATVSDDGVDQYATRMTTDLHDDFIRNAERRGMPWLTIAHYNQLARIGRATKLYRDGRRLKAEGVFFTDDKDDFIRKLATAAAEKALEEQEVIPRLREVRTSIGFKPNAAVAEDLGVMAYTRGHLPEITLTTHPGNSRADFGAQQRSGDMEKRISPEFMQIDASTIVGEELAADLDERLKKVLGKGEDRSGDDDPMVLLYRSMEQNEIDVSTLDEAHLYAAAHNADLTPDLKEKLEERYGELERTPPWKREASKVIDRIEEISELFVMEDAGLVGKGAFQRAKERLVEDVALDKVVLVGQDDVEIQPAVDDKPWGVKTRFGYFEMPPIPDKEELLQRAGRRLQGKRLEQLEGVANSLQEAANGLQDLVAWAKENDEGGNGEERSHEPQEVEPAADFRKTLMTRLYGSETDPEQGLIETMEFQETVNVVMNATFTLADIIVANITPENEIELDERVTNVERALGEYAQILNGIIMSAFGGGRSADPDTSKQPNDVSGPTDVKPEGVDTGAVNPNGRSEGQPDLASFDERVTHLRQLVIDKASPEDLQDALEDFAKAIEEALPQSGDDEGLTGRVAQMEVVMSQLQAMLEEINRRSQEPPEHLPTDTPPPRLTPRRRSLPPGPRPGDTPPNPQDGLSRTGGGRRKIEDVVRRSTRTRVPYP